MSVTNDLLNGLWLWLWLAHLLFAGIVVIAAWRVPWQVLFEHRGLQHLFLGATVILLMTWSFRAGISPGLSIHFLGMTALTLILGWDLAIISATLVLLGITLEGTESWQGVSINGLCLVVLPALLTHAIKEFVESRFPKNFFVYLFLCSFLGAALVIAASGMSMMSILWLSGAYSWAKIMAEYVQYLPLIMFPEGLMNGIVMTGVMVFYPDWIRTFDAQVYIDDQ